MSASRMLPKPKTKLTAPWKLLEQLHKNWLLLDAPYQRDIVWDDAKMSELIDSIFYNYYIPPLVFAVRRIRGRQARMVIDGKQRITSIRRFMQNELPYLDRSSGRKLWYSSEIESGNAGPDAEYLSEEQMNAFNSFEFVCMEYTGISEDDEFDIFSRVQLGVAITTAEKLKAHNSPVAEICREMTDDFPEIQELLPKKGKPHAFQTIAQIMLTIDNGKELFATTPKALNDFVSAKTAPPETLVETTRRVLRVFQGMASSEKLREKILRFDHGRKLSIKALEFVCFAMFIASVQRLRSMEAYADDFAELRRYLHDRRDGKIYMGKEAFGVGMEFVEEHLSQHDLVSARPQVHEVIESDGEGDDELKYSEYEPEPHIIRAPPSKRSRAEPNSRHNHPNIAIAKRGRVRK